MVTWGLGFVSLGFLLITYRNFLLGVLSLALGAFMFFYGRKKDKENPKEENNEKK
jgi:hypothetical protein